VVWIKIGPIRQTAEDLAIVFNIINGSDGIDQSLYDASFTYDHKLEIKKLKIGYLKDDFDKQYDFHDNDSASLAKLRELGAELIPISLPKFPINDLSIILSAEAAAAFDLLTRNNEDDLMVRQIKNAWPNSSSSRFIQRRNIKQTGFVYLIKKCKSCCERLILHAPSRVV